MSAGIVCFCRLSSVVFVMCGFIYIIHVCFFVVVERRG